MRRKSIIIGIAFGLCFILYSFRSWSAQENLDEVIARQERQYSASWGYKYLEDRNNHYIWQPETLCYYDVLTGKEVWRLTASSGVDNTLPDIGFRPSRQPSVHGRSRFRRGHPLHVFR